MNATAAEVIAFAERTGRPLTRWQREATEALFSGRPVAIPAARRSGRTTWQRILTEHAATRGEHVHAVRHDGQWCVTRQPIGYLYAKVRRA